MNISISMDRRPIILVPSSFSCHKASNDTDDDPNGPTLKYDPGHCQGRHITVTSSTAKASDDIPILPTFRKFALHRSLVRKTARLKTRNDSRIYDDRKKRRCLVLLRPIRIHCSSQIGETGSSWAGFCVRWHKFGMIKNINICLL